MAHPRGLILAIAIATIALKGAHGLIPLGFAFAQPAEMDAKGEARAKEAMRFYKQGRYEEAAELFANLSVDYPTMPIFERNVGACFYYLKKPEPALSNLRNYLNHKKDIAPDDKMVVDRWIAEMEQLRAQPAVPAAPAPGEPAGRAATEPTGSTHVPAPEPTAPAPLPEATPIATAATPAPGLDISGQAQSGNPTPASRPFYKSWWFWTGTGVVAAGVVTAIVLSSGGSKSNVPASALGNQGALR